MKSNTLQQLEALLDGMTYTVVGEMPYLPLAWNTAQQGPFTKEGLLISEQILVRYDSPEAYLSAFGVHYAGDAGQVFAAALKSFCQEVSQPIVYGYGFPRNTTEMTAKRELERLPLGIPVITWQLESGTTAGILLRQGRRYKAVPFSTAKDIDPALSTQVETKAGTLAFPLSGHGWDVQNSWYFSTAPDRSAIVETLLYQAGYLSDKLSMRDFLRLDEEEGDHSREQALFDFFEGQFEKNELLTVYYSVMDEMWSIYYGLGYETNGDVLGFSTIGFSM